MAIFGLPFEVLNDIQQVLAFVIELIVSHALLADLIFQTFKLFLSLSILPLRSRLSLADRCIRVRLGLTLSHTDQFDLFLEYNNLFELPFDHLF